MIINEAIEIIENKITKLNHALEALQSFNDDDDDNDKRKKIIKSIKKKHWSQTPEGKKRMSRIMKKKWRLAKKNGHKTLYTR